MSSGTFGLLRLVGFLLPWWPQYPILLSTEILATSPSAIILGNMCFHCPFYCFGSPTMVNFLWRPGTTSCFKLYSTLAESLIHIGHPYTFWKFLVLTILAKRHGAPLGLPSCKVLRGRPASSPASSPDLWVQSSIHGSPWSSRLPHLPWL